MKKGREISFSRDPLSLFSPSQDIQEGRQALKDFCWLRLFFTSTQNVRGGLCIQEEHRRVKDIDKKKREKEKKPFEIEKDRKEGEEKTGAAERETYIHTHNNSFSI